MAVFSHSRRRCIESVIALLSLQGMSNREVETKGSVRASHWFRIPPASHDFTLATMILCLELRRKGEGAPNGDKVLSGDSQESPMLQGLQTSRNMWREVQASSPEAWKAYRVLSSMLGVDEGVGEGVGALSAGGMPVSSSSDSEQPFLGFNNVQTLSGDSVPPAGDID